MRNPGGGENTADDKAVRTGATAEAATARVKLPPPAAASPEAVKQFEKLGSAR